MNSHDMPKLLAGLLEDAKGAKEEGTLEVGRFWLTYWLFLLWFHEVSRKRFIKRVRVRRKFVQEVSLLVLQKELKRAKGVEGDVRERQIRFFTDILPDEKWLEIARGQDEPTASDYHSLVRKRLAIEDPLPSSLVKPESLLLESDGSIAILSLCVSASSARYAYFTQGVAESIYQRHGETWGNSNISFQAFRDASQEWLAKEYKEHASDPSRRGIEELGHLAEFALAPVVLCHFAFWIRKLNIPPPLWEAFCVPEVVRDGCQFILNKWKDLLFSSGTMVVVERENGRWVAKMRPQGIDFLSRLSLRDLSRLMVKGFGHLAQENPEYLSFVFETQGRELKAPASTPIVVMKRGGGLTALALLTLFQEKGVVESSLSKKKDEAMVEAETALSFLLPSVESSRVRGEEVEFLQSLKPLTKTNSGGQLLEQFLEQALTRTVQEIEEVFRSAEYVWALLSTNYFREIQEEVVRRINRAFDRRNRYSVAEGFDPKNMVLGRMFEVVCEFPLTERSRAGQAIAEFLVEKLRDMCREEYGLHLKIKTEPVDFVTDAAPEREDEGSEAIGESAIYHRISETVRERFVPDPLQSLDELEFSRLYIAALRNGGLKPREKKVLKIFLRECRWGGTRDVEEIHRIIAQELKVSPENVRQIKRRALQVVGPELLSLLHERLSR